MRVRADVRTAIPQQRLTPWTLVAEFNLDTKPAAELLHAFSQGADLVTTNVAVFDAGHRVLTDAQTTSQLDPRHLQGLAEPVGR
jgi:hypothetical protein